MHSLSTLFSTWSAVSKSSLTIPPAVHEFAGQSGGWTEQIPLDLACYGFLVSILIAMLSLLISALLMGLTCLLPRSLRDPSRMLTVKRSPKMIKSRIAEANRRAFYLASAQIRSGQLSN